MVAVLTLLEAAKRSQNKLFAGIGQAIVTTNEMAAMLPMRAVAGGQALVYEREGTAPDVAFMADDGTGAGVGTASSGTGDMVTTHIRAIASDLDVNSLANDLSNGDAMARAVLGKVKATWGLVSDTIINGGHTTSHTLGSSADPFAAIDAITYGPWLDSNRYGPGSIKYTHAGTLWQFRAPGDPDYGDAVAANADGVYELRSFNRSKWIRVTLDVSDATGNGETHIRFASSNNKFDGLKTLCASSQVIESVGAAGDAFSFGVLDQLMDLVKSGRESRAFFANSAVVRKFLAAQRTLGGTSPSHIQIPGYGGPVLEYRGIPFLTCDYIANNESKGGATTLSSIYLAGFSADEGLFAGVPSATDQLDVSNDPRIAPVMGFRIVDLGERETVAHQRIRCKWYGALGLRSELALARASEIVTA